MATVYVVSTKANLISQMTAALPGDTVIVADGTYDWGQINFINNNGTSTSAWIVLKAQTPGSVIFMGTTYLHFKGTRVEINGFNFANGNSGTNAVISFRYNSSNLSNYCRVTNIVFDNYNTPSVDSTTENDWVGMYGTNNRLDHCTFINKYNARATVVVWYSSTTYPAPAISTYHRIDSNYFKGRSFQGANGGETIRIGDSNSSRTDGFNTIEYNLFENCTQVEPEIISNKSDFNTYRYNTFKNSDGGLTLRHGRYCEVYGNFFIVDNPARTRSYGVRVIDKGHKVFNNYFEGLLGNKNSLTSLRTPINLYNGRTTVIDSADATKANGYFPAEDAIVAFNTIVNCSGGAGIVLGYRDGGSNTFQPQGIVVANNLIKMTSGQAALKEAANTTLTYSAEGNIYNAPNGAGISPTTGFTNSTLTFGTRANGILPPPSLVQDAAINTAAYISLLYNADVQSQVRSALYDVGADEINGSGAVLTYPLDSSKVGAFREVVTPAIAPTIAPTDLVFSAIGTNAITLIWTNGNGASRLVLAKAASPVDSDPVNGTGYTAAVTFGSGSQLGTGNYAVYSGDGNSVTVTGLSAASRYHFGVYEFNGTGGGEAYLTASFLTGNAATDAAITAISKQNGNWVDASTWVDGVTPSAIRNVVISNGHTVVVENSGKQIYNLTIDAGGKLFANTALTTNRYLRIFGSSITNNGTFGDVADGLSVESEFNNGTLTISGTGSTYICRLRPRTAFTSQSIVFDANVNFTYSGTTVGSGGSSLYGFNSDNDNISFTVNTGKTLTFNPFSNFSTNSSVVSNGAAAQSILINGTVILSANANLNIRTTSAKNSGLIVNGTLNVGGNFNATNGGSIPNVTVNSGGLLSIGGTAEFTDPAMVVMGAGTYTQQSGTIQTGNSGGVNASGNSGVIQTATRNFNAGISYIFNGTTAQVTGTAVTNALDLTVANSAGVSLTSPLTVSGTLTSTAGALDLGANNLTLKSTATRTARHAQTAVANPILYSGAGKIIVERYISDIGRKWRLLSTRSVISTQTIFDSWQEAGAAVNNLGVWITKPGGGNGFDGSSNSASILKHNQVTPSWLAPAATNTGTVNDEQGYMLFVRGDRNDNPGNVTNSPTVLRTAGQLRTGTQPAVSVSSSGSGRTLVGNPFASPINMENVFSGTANLDQNMFVWDPALSGNFGLGGYRSVVRTGVNAYDQTPVVFGGTVNNDPTIQFIHSGQAFFLKATGANASVVFTESMKATTPTIVYNPIVATPGDQQIIVNLMTVNPGDIVSLADGIRVRFDPAYHANLTDDIEKMGNFGENISSYRDSKKLIVEKRPLIAKNDSIFLHLTNTGVKNYRFQIGAVDFVQENVQAFLQDTYLHTNTALDLTGAINNIDFNTSTEPASANPDRFRIVFAVSAPLPSTVTTIKAAKQGQFVYVEWKAFNQFNIKQYELEKSTDGVNYTRVNVQAAASANGSDATYRWMDVNLVSGSNFYRVKTVGIGGDKSISEVVVVESGKLIPGIIVYPNPAINNSIGLQFKDQEPGKYGVRIVNQAAQTIFTGTVNLTAGNAGERLLLHNKPAVGTYKLEIIKPDKSKITKTIIIAD